MSVNKFEAGGRGNTKVNKAMGLVLKRLRRDAGLTMRELGDKLGTPHTLVGKLESNDREITVTEFITYLKELEADPTKVFRQVMEVYEEEGQFTK